VTGCWKEPAVLSSDVIHAGELLAAGAVALTAGLWWLRLRVRRFRRAAAARACAAAVSAASAGRRRAWALPLPDRRWLAGARQRRRLWRAVGAAEDAVAAARQAGAPTGDLDGLCRRLRQAAADAGRGLSVSPAASSGVSEVAEAAGLIAEAATSAASAVTQPAYRRLAEDVRREAEALAAGIAAAGLSGTPAGPRPAAVSGDRGDRG
jgi:hypothetical protein